MSILKSQARDTTKQLNIRVSADLADRIEKLRAAAKEKGYTIDLTEAVEAALTKAITAAQKELDKS
jgi:hypothetical protein